MFVFPALTALSFALLAASAGPEASPGEGPDGPPGRDDDYQIILSNAPAAGSCAPEATLDIELDDLLPDFEDHVGKCVSTEGYLKSRALFFRKSDLRRRHPSSNRASAGRRIGLYGGDDLMRAAAELDAKRVRVTGIVYSCADLGEPGDLVLGYCHYSGGPFIGLTAVRGVDASD